MLPTHRTALVEMTRWSISIIAFGTTRPEGVDDRLDILLVHDDVADTDPLKRLVAGDLGVVELDDDGRALDRLGPGFHRQGLRLLGQLGDLGVAGVLLAEAGRRPTAASGPGRPPSAFPARLPADQVGQVRGAGA